MFSRFFFVPLAFLFSSARTAKIEDFCQVNEQNTPCITQCQRAEACGDTGDHYVPLTWEERQQVVDVHNDLRELVASGNLSSSYLPACEGGISALSYSRELEFMAACWINQCKFAHDKVRLDSTGAKCGQNLHQVYSSAILGWLKHFIPNAVQRWFDEYKLFTAFDKDIVHKFRSKKGVGHFTALVWGTTKYVGCAKLHNMQRRRSDPSKIDHAYNLYCNYGPAGNWLDTPIYEDKPCERYNSKWPHLCGECRGFEEDTFRAPEIPGWGEGEELPGNGSGRKTRAGLEFLPPMFVLHRILRS